MTIAEQHPGFVTEKKAAIDFAIGRWPINRVAELGCAYGVDCAYGRYVAERSPGTAVVCVDDEWTDSAIEAVGAHPNITRMDALIGAAGVPAKIGKVDAVILFWVLLHLVAPDWDEVLAAYSTFTDTFIVANPQWLGPRTVRLWDLGLRDYLDNVVVMDRREEIGNIFRNAGRAGFPSAHNYWQWGITDHDLNHVMKELGFRQEYCKSTGRFRGLPRFVDSYFVFRKSGLGRATGFGQFT